MKIVPFARFISGILILMLPAVIPVSGQADTSRKALKYFEKAQSYFQSGQWKDSENELYKAIKADSNLADSYILLGDVFLETGRSAEAISQYRHALRLNPKREDVVYNLLANTLFSLERYAESASYYEKILAYPDINQDLKTAIGLKLNTSRFRLSLMDNPVSFLPVNLGPSVNTASDEYINTLSADGSGLFFTRRTRSSAGDIRDFNEDFYLAEIKMDSILEASKLNYPPGKDNDAGALCISTDGRMLFFTACNRPDSYGSCDLYFSEKTGDTWSVANNLGRHINSESWDAQPSISPDGQSLYFSSNRPGGLGSSDIWKTDRTAEGGWSRPVNLGPPVNTPAAEMAPFIHFDNQTLYFSSSGHPGLGGSDLFKSTRHARSWTLPVNLGYPINSLADELVIVVNAKGSQGLISSNNLKGEGGYDIFGFELYDAIRPVPVTYLKGKVYDKVSGIPLEARFELIDISLDSIIIGAISDRQNGEFLVCIPGNRNYALNVSCNGYLFYSDHFPLSEIKSRMDPVLKDIPMEPVAVGKTIILRNIFYETDQFQLKTISYTELDKLVSFLQINPGLRIEVGGHTDDQGAEDYNLDLSRKRALAVYDYLLSHGIDEDRISYNGYGESKPVNSNETEAGRALNRRTEVTILESN